MNITVDYVGLQNLLSCINLILQPLTNESTIIFQVNQEFRLNYPAFQKNYHVLTRPKHHWTKWLDSPKPYIYLVNIDEVPVAMFVEKMRREFYNLGARIILIGRHFSSSDVAILTESYIFNFIFVAYPTGEIKTAFPYKLKNFHNLSTELERIGYCHGGKLFSEPNLFPDKIPSYWENAKLHMIYRRWEPYTINPRSERKGIEFDLLEIILERMKLTAKYKNEEGFRSNTLVYQKYIRQSDIQFGNLRAGFNADNDQTTPYICFSVFWYVPRPDVLPKWKLVFKAFSMDLVLLLGILIMVFSLLWYVAYAVLKNQRTICCFLNKLWVIFTLILEQPAVLVTEFMTFIILIFLVLQSFLIVNVLYKAKYTAMLSMDHYDDSIRSLEDIMEKNLLLGLTVNMEEFFFSNPKARNYMEKNHVPCNINTNECLFRSASQKDMAVVESQMKVDFFHRLFMDEFGVSYLNKINPPLVTRCSTFFFTVGHPMYPAVEKYMKYLVTHGFVQKVVSKYLPVFSNKNSELSKTKIGFDSVKVAFMVLFLGNFLAILLFGFEKLPVLKIKKLTFFKI